MLELPPRGPTAPRDADIRYARGETVSVFENDRTDERLLTRPPRELCAEHD
jgi:hypothetical protein